MDYKEFRRNCVTSRESKIFFLCGSTFELPLKYVLNNPTDSDRLFYMMDVCAVPSNRNPPKYFKGTVLTIESTGNHPGFVRLKRRTHVRRLHTLHSSYFLRPTNLLDDDSGGPARKVNGEYSISSKVQAALQYLSPTWKNLNSMKIDEAHSVYCPCWPPEAQEWVTRRRYYGWPDTKLIGRVKKGGCHFVSKPHKNNADDDTQWRFSFTKAELILTHSWSPVQNEIYHLLRLAKNKACKDNPETALRTYHFKTLMLWACEEKPTEFWNECRKNDCVRELLMEMIVSISNRHCPNYFIPENNMLDYVGGYAFENELTILENYVIDQSFALTSKFIEILQRNNSSFWLSNKFYEFIFLSVRAILLPLHEDSNGTLRSNLYKCECFLPELKKLYDAINANILLMSIPRVSWRTGSREHEMALRGYTIALNASVDETQRILEFDISRLLDTSLNAMLPTIACWPLFLHRKGCAKILEAGGGCELSESADKSRFPESSSLKSESATEESTRNSSMIMKLLEKLAGYSIQKFATDSSKQIPSPMYLMSAAYLVNFYYTTLNDYENTLRIYDEIHIKTSKIRNIFGTYIHFLANLPMTVCTDFSVLFDDHIRTVLGFVVLYKASSSCSHSDNSMTVAFPLSPIRFLRYVEYQCKLKIDGSVPNVFAYSPGDHENANNSTRMTVCFSEVFLSAALRCNGVKILRISSRNFDTDFTFDEVVGRICCCFEKYTTFEQECPRILSSLSNVTDSENQLDLHSIGFLTTELRAGQLLLYFHFSSKVDVERMHKKLKSGEVKTLVEKDFNRLLHRTELLISVSVQWFKDDYKRCLQCFRRRL